MWAGTLEGNIFILHIFGSKEKFYLNAFSHTSLWLHQIKNTELKILDYLMPHLYIIIKNIYFNLHVKIKEHDIVFQHGIQDS